LSEETIEERTIREEVSRRAAAEAMEEMGIPRFLTTDDKVLSIFLEPLMNVDGTPILDSEQHLQYHVPAENNILQKTMILLNSHLSRTGNMTEKEGRLFKLKVKRLFLMLEAENNEESYEGELWALYEDLKLHLEGAIRDNVGGWRGRLLTVKEWYAHLTTTGQKKKGLLGGIFKR